MIVTATLTHCIEVTVYPPPGGGPPLAGDATVTAGGAAGDGTVSVTSTPAGAAPPVVPTGSTVGPFDATPIKEIRMHYVAEPGRPLTVEVTIQPPTP